VVLPEATYPPGNRRAAFYRQLEGDLAGIPSAERVSLASVAPLLGAPTRRMAIRGSGTDGDAALTAAMVEVGVEDFDTVEIALLRGRPCDRADSLESRNVAVVNALVAERFLAGQDPIGPQVRVSSAEDRATGPGHPVERSGDAAWLTVIGVSPTIRHAIAAGHRPVVYVPHLRTPDLSVQVLLRTRAFSASMIRGIQTRVAVLDERVLVSNVRPLADSLRHSRLQSHLIATVLGSLGLIALLLSAVGLYAITDHGVRQCTTEIGILLALGGQPAQVVWLFMRRGLAPIPVGLLLGLAGALGVGQLLRAFLIGTAPTDAATFAALSVLLTTVTVTACLVPTLSGTRPDPAATLRKD
jgi:putative ABC transport system permease protein